MLIKYAPHQALRTSVSLSFYNSSRTDLISRVRTLTGKEIELDIEPDYTVSKIKERVEEKEGIPPPQQRLIFGGKQMYVLIPVSHTKELALQPPV